MMFYLSAKLGYQLTCRLRRAWYHRPPVADLVRSPDERTYPHLRSYQCVACAQVRRCLEPGHLPLQSDSSIRLLSCRSPKYFRHFVLNLQRNLFRSYLDLLASGEDFIRSSSKGFVEIRPCISGDQLINKTKEVVAWFLEGLDQKCSEVCHNCSVSSSELGWWPPDT